MSANYPRWLPLRICGLCACLLFGLAPSAAAMDVLPAPTGPHATGRMSFHWRDDAREELETAAPGDKRELMVHVFFPAEPNSTAERAGYVPDADLMVGPFKQEQVDRVAAMRSFSRQNAAPLAGEAKFPVIFFSPGGALKVLTYHALLEDLASHGWVVAAIDPPYNAKAVRLPDGRVLGNLKPAERGWPQPKSAEEHQKYYVERIVHWSRDISFVIDQLVALAKGDGPLAGRLDLDRGVGVLGHSRGGQAAGAVRILDDRVRGGINLDGMAGEYAIMPVKPDVSGAAPFLWVHKRLPPPPTDEQLKRAKRTRAEFDAEFERVTSHWQKQLTGVSGGAVRLCLNRPGITHIDFSDEPYWDGSMTDAARPGKLQTIAETRALVRAFFDGALGGDWSRFHEVTNDEHAAKSQTEVLRYGVLAR